MLILFIISYFISLRVKPHENYLPILILNFYFIRLLLFIIALSIAVKIKFYPLYYYYYYAVYE